jgi:two-component system cell cycle sensor histidine kinase/response regulator CckA
MGRLGGGLLSLETELLTEQRVGFEVPMADQTILVVDDEPADLDKARKSLETLGFTVLTAGDGVSAIKAYRDRGHPVELLITDVAMAPMNGCDLALRLSKYQENIKVLFVSGYTGSQVLTREGMRGLDAEFLRKPFTGEQLANTVRAILGAGQKQSAGSQE